MPAPLTADTLDRPTRLLAGPGTGKTAVLVRLYAELVAGGMADRGDVLVLTFSTAAAGEITRRLDLESGLPDSYGEAWIHTFHGFCARLLREYRPEPFGLILSGFQEAVAMRETLARLESGELGRLGRVARTDGFAQDALGFVALLKQNRVYPAEFGLLAEASGTPRLRELAALYSAYQARLRAAGARDFRDLVADATALLGDRPEVRERYRRKFRYVLVDEFQDVDPAQFDLLSTLAPPGGETSLLVAGDPDQSVYGFRGTVPALLAREFPEVYRGRTEELDVSYRCPDEVLEAGRRLMEATQLARRARVLKPAPREGTGAEPPIRVVRETNAVEEALFVAREVRRLMLEDPGLRPRDFAILLRSTTTLAAPFEEALRALDLPYEVRGVGALARNEVVRFLLTYLRVVAQPDEPESLERLLASGLSGVERRATGRIRRYAVEEGRSFTKVVRRLMYWLRARDPVAFPLPWEVPGAASAPPQADSLPLAERVREGVFEREPAEPAKLDEPGQPNEQADAAEAPEPPAEPPQERELEFARYLTDRELAALHRAVSTFYSVGRAARRLPLRALAYHVLLEAGVMERVLQLPLEEAARRQLLADLRIAMEAFGELESVWERLFGEPPWLSDVGTRLESWIARAVDEAQPAPSSVEGVQLLTVHQSKGLEFEVVFLSGFAQGLFPLAARPHALLEEADQRWLEGNVQGFRPSWPDTPGEHGAEEARLAYVGMTRARRHLVITYAEEYDDRAGPSPFLEVALPESVPEEPARTSTELTAAGVLTLGEAETLLAGLALDNTQRSRLAAAGVDLDFVDDPAAGQPFEPYLRGPISVDPGHFSPTALNDYLKCPRLYWYNHHPGLAAAPRGIEMERGSFLHRVLEEFHAKEDEWRGLPPDRQRDWLQAALEGHLERYLERQEVVLERRAEEQEVRRILDNYVRFATSLQAIRRRGTLMVERKFVLQLDGAEIHGKIDRVNDTGEGTCEVVDYKTGRGQPAQRAYDNYFGEELLDVQLLMYYLACRFGVDEEGRPLDLNPRYLSLWYPKDTWRGRMRQVLFAVGEPAQGVPDGMQRTVTPGDLQRGRTVVAEAVSRIRVGDFAPAPRDAIGTCLSWFGCPHAAICPYGGQPVE
jgi:superfamily I DNA/RNA helicase/RecB family exonuclease